MIFVICGSRGWTDVDAIEAYVGGLPPDSIVIHGGAEGADRQAGAAAEDSGFFVAEVACKPRHWRRFGRSAGHKRNAAMLALKPDRVVAFSLGTAGTQGTIDRARRLGIHVTVFGREQA